MSNTHQLRRRLEKALPTDPDRNAFVLDFFPAVHQRFSSAMDGQEKLTLLLTLVDAADIEASLAKYEAGKSGQATAPAGSATAPAGPEAKPETKPETKPDTKPDTKGSGEIDWRSPGAVLQAAIAAVPVMKYALAVAGLAAVVAMVTRGFGLDAPTATLGSLIVLVLMTVLLVLAVAARQSQQLARQAQVLTWAFVVMTLSAMALLLASLFFLWPRPLRCLVHDEACAPPRPTESSRVAPASSPSVVATAVPLLPSAAPPPTVIDLPIASTPQGAKVRSADNAELCKTTPCTLKVPAHSPLELRFEYPGRDYTFKTADPSLDLLRGGVNVNIPPSKVQ